MMAPLKPYAEADAQPLHRPAQVGLVRLRQQAQG